MRSYLSGKVAMPEIKVTFKEYKLIIVRSYKYIISDKLAGWVHMYL